jgi:hypothetical protein
VDYPFIFGKTNFLIIYIALSDAELEENLENLPLLIAKVEEKDWFKFS